MSLLIPVLVVMGIILITQYFTSKTTYALAASNRQAVETFRINNRIQQLVNLSFALQSTFSKPGLIADDHRKALLTDSLTVLGYNSTVLADAITKIDKNKNVQLLDKEINNQINLSLDILNAASPNRETVLIDSLKKIQFGNKIYTICLEVQRSLENNLEHSLIKNSKEANQLSIYNKVLAIFAVLAILAMATIIILRQMNQIKLIDDLKKAESSALKSKNAKDDFLANMSHELRTPLNALIGFGNLLSQTDLNEKQTEYLGIIQSSGYNLLNVVNDILDLSKIEAGKLKIINVPFSLTELLGDMENMFSTSIHEKGLSYSWSIDEKIPAALKGDPGRLRQILINLINNAIKFTSHGGVRVTTGIIWTDEITNKLKLGFNVIDTGTGIPPEKISIIFERFEQLEHGVVRQHGGTGLGLTIVKNIVEKLGGAISVFSEVDKGSEFNFTCIFEKTDAAALSGKSFETLNKISFEKEKILLVEDNKANQSLLKHILQKHKCSPTFADNGRIAIDLLQQESYDIILMDIQMPVMDGYTAVKIIRDTLKLKIPVIAMTAYVSETEIEKCLKVGFNDYIPKPLEERELIEKLSKFIIDKTHVMEKDISDKEQGSNLDYLKDLVDGDMDVLKEILNEVQNQWKSDKLAIDAAVATNNVAEIKRILHRAKSTFSPFGPNHKIYDHIKIEGEQLIEDEISVNKLNSEHFVKKTDEIIAETISSV